jgi:pimeloyl-ACP methyl ester carboxylesterase
MGCIVAKIVFQPPERDVARAALGNNPNLRHCVIPAGKYRGQKISYVVHSAETVDRIPVTLLYCHGNAEDVSTTFDGLRQLSGALGVDIVCFDYLGYGCSDGTHCTEEACYACVKEMFQFTFREKKHGGLGVPRKNVVVLGRSLGSGAAVHLAALEDTSGIGGLVLVSPLCTVCSVLGKAVGWFLRPFDMFMNKQKIAAVTNTPILIVHGDEDEVVPYSHGVELSRVARGSNNNVTFWTAKGCGHNDIDVLQWHEYLRQIKSILEEVALRGNDRQEDQNYIPSCPTSVS